MGPTERTSSATLPEGAPQSRAEAGAAASPGRGRAALNVIRAALVVALAFFLGSAPARNSDLWLHLAAGRALVQGEYTPGTDPFAHTTEGVYWVNHSWLWDVLAYGLYAEGGELLAVVKAVAVALLAGLMLACCWRGRAGWLAALAVAAGVVALGPYLALRPALASYLLLACTLWWLRAAWEGPRRGLLFYAVLPALFALWANLDEWFLLGPLTAGLFVLGAFLEHRRDADRGAARPDGAERLRALALAAAVGLAAVLLNPHHVRVLGLPAALGAGAGMLPPEEVTGFDPSASPLASASLRLAYATPAGVAYVLLVAGGLVSFGLAGSVRALSFPRALVWVALLGLSAYRAAGVPLFAVAAAPVLVLNVQDYLARRPAAAAPGPRARRLLLVGQLATVVALAALAVAAWPGWLQGSAGEPWRWAVEADPSLGPAARQLAAWRADGRLGPGDRAYNFSPAAAHAFAWLAPGEKGFLDARPGLFPPEVVADYLAVRAGLLAADAPDSGEAAADWRAALRRRDVTHVVVHDPNERRLTAALRRLFESPREWALVHLEGRTAVFAWRDPAAPRAAVALPVVDLHRRAFRPAPDRLAPAAGPGRDPKAREWQDAFTTPLPGPDVNRDEALACITHFQSQRGAYLEGHAASWTNGLSAALVGLGASGAGPCLLPGAELRTWLLLTSLAPPPAPGAVPPPREQAAHQMMRNFARLRDDGPPGSLLLAVRAARRAVHDNPDDPRAHLMLGHAYLRLVRNTRERAAVATSPLLARVRMVQAATAFKNALVLKPDLPEAHESLADLYLREKHLDLGLQHLRQLLELTRAAGPPPGVSAEQFRERLKQLDDEVFHLGKGVRENLNLVDARSSSIDAYARALLALERGLPGEALKTLQGADLASVGRDGAVLQIDLLLLTGQPALVRAWIDPEVEKSLGEAYRTLRLQFSAAVGDYALAAEDAKRLEVTYVIIKEFKVERGDPLQVMALLIGKRVLEDSSDLPSLAREDLRGALARINSVAGHMRRRAELLTLRGLFALEVGEADRAAGLFREAESAWPEDGGPAGLARHYLDLIGQ